MESKIDSRQLRHEIYGARKVVNKAYAELMPALTQSLPPSRPVSSRGVPSSPHAPLAPNPPRKRVATSHGSRRAVPLSRLTESSLPHRITAAIGPVDDGMVPSSPSCASYSVVPPLESSDHFKQSELSKSIALWRAHAQRLKEGTFKSVYRWAHHCLDTAESSTTTAGDSWVGDDLGASDGGDEGEASWKAKEESLGKRAGVACGVLDTLMAEICADTDLWAKLRPLLYSCIYHGWPGQTKEQPPSSNSGTVTSSALDIADHRSYAGSFYALKASYERLSHVLFAQSSSLQTVKASFLAKVQRGRQESLRRAFTGWRGVVNSKTAWRRKLDSTFRIRNESQMLATRFNTWRLAWVQTRHRRGRFDRRRLHASEDGPARSRPNSASPTPTTSSPLRSADTAQTQRTLTTLQSLLVEEREMRSRDFLSFTSEIARLNEQLTATECTLTTTRGQKALWRSLWLTFHREQCLPVPLGDHLSALLPRLKGATEYLLWFAQQRLDAALLLSEVHRVVASNPETNDHLQSVMAASTSRRPSVADSQTDGHGKKRSERSKSRVKRGSVSSVVAPQVSGLLSRASENVFVTTAKTMLGLPPAPHCLVDVRHVWAEDGLPDAIQPNGGSHGSLSLAAADNAFPGIPHLESVSSMQSVAIPRSDSVVPAAQNQHHRAVDEVFEKNTKLLREELEAVVVAWVNRMLTLREELIERETGVKGRRARLLSSLDDDLPDGEIYSSLLDAIERASLIFQPNFYAHEFAGNEKKKPSLVEAGEVAGDGRMVAARAVVKALQGAVERGSGAHSGPYPPWCQTPLSACTDSALLSKLASPRELLLPTNAGDSPLHLWVLTTLLCDFSARLANPEECADTYLPQDRAMATHPLVLQLAPLDGAPSALPPCFKLLLLHNRSFANSLPSVKGVSGVSVLQAVQRASIISSEGARRGSQSVTELRGVDEPRPRSGSGSLPLVSVAAPAADANFLGDPRLLSKEASPGSTSMLSVASQISASSPRLHVRRATAAPTDGTLPGEEDQRKAPTPRPSFSGWLPQVPSHLGELDSFRVEMRPVTPAEVPTISVQHGDGDEAVVVATPPSPTFNLPQQRRIVEGIAVVEEQDSESNSLSQSLQLPDSYSSGAQLPLLKRRVPPPLPSAVADVAENGYVTQNVESGSGEEGCPAHMLQEAGPMGNPTEGFVKLRWYRELHDATAPLVPRDYKPADSETSADHQAPDAPTSHPAFVEMPDLVDTMDTKVVPAEYDAVQWYHLTREARSRRQEWLALGRVVAAAVVGCRCLDEPKVLVEEVRTTSTSPRRQSMHLSVSNVSRTSNAKRLSEHQQAGSLRRKSDNANAAPGGNPPPYPSPLPSPKQSRKVSAASNASSSKSGGRDTPPNHLPVSRGTIVGILPTNSHALHRTDSTAPTPRSQSPYIPAVPTNIRVAAFNEMITGSSCRL